jgi:RNA polymerase sigma factor (sigma-70 family)
MTAVEDWAIISDSELVAGVAEGDRSALAEIYDRYADMLFDFCVGLGCDRDTAADCVHDVFCRAVSHLDQLRNPEKLRTWLYAIARSEALRYLRKRHRETVSSEIPDAESEEPGPDKVALRAEVIHLVTQAADGLTERDRRVLALVYCHGLDAPEIADVLDVSPSHAHVLIHRLRQNIERSLGALLVARSTNTTPCQDLSAIIREWDGKFTILVRKRIDRHIRSCAVCDRERRRLASPAALFGGAPLLVSAPTSLRHETLDGIELVCTTSSLGGQSGDGSGLGADVRPNLDNSEIIQSARGRRRGWRQHAVLSAGLIAAAAAIAISLSSQQHEPALPGPISPAFAVYTYDVPSARVAVPSIDEDARGPAASEPIAAPSIRVTPQIAPPALPPSLAAPVPVTNAPRRTSTPTPITRAPIIRATVKPRTIQPPPHLRHDNRHQRKPKPVDY